ncbi:MAG TPA: carotenoid 1,2-hydratase [Gammaproteobacteria bacterium]|nr:carotenoid 1,2-hydratase [Gammaproteobacteria bacterium]
MATLLGAEASAAYQRADRVRAFSFPADHAAHDGFRNEWWYFTGHLRDPAGRRFGYQVTFFRVAITPGKPAAASAWATQYVWMGHVALSDVANQRHHHDERFVREAAGLAGVQPEPLSIWLEDWQLQAVTESAFPWRLQVAATDFALEMTLQPEKPPVLNGERGLSRKSGEVGNASYYYSMTRLQSSGHVTLDGERFAVEGQSWLDREWSTSALGQDQQGWDWFSLQLADGRDLMYYQLRQRDGTADEHSSGTWVDAEGNGRNVSSSEVTLSANRYWRSPSGARYPTDWTLQVAGESRPWRVRALFDAQEMRTLVDYWEGAVAVTDAQTGEPLGVGYLEMTGY